MMKDKLISERRFVEDLYGCLNGFDFDLEDVLNVLKGVESVDAVPVVHGHWIGEDYDGYSDGCPVYFSYRCSKCNAIFQTNDEPLDFDFCPHCGAKMDEKGCEQE